MPEVLDRQERVEAAFEHSFTSSSGRPSSSPRCCRTYHRFRNHLLRMWSAFQEAQAEHDRAERESADRFWQGLRMVRLSRAQGAEAWAIFNDDEDRLGEVSIIWGERTPTASSSSTASAPRSGAAGSRSICRLEQEILVEEPGVFSYARLAEGVRRRVLPVRRLRRAAQPVRR